MLPTRAKRQPARKTASPPISRPVEVVPVKPVAVPLATAPVIEDAGEALRVEAIVPVAEVGAEPYGAPEERRGASRLRDFLATKESLRAAVLAREILGPPRGLQSSAI